MINRRKFLEAGAAAGVTAMLPLKVGRAAEAVARAGIEPLAPAVPGVSPVLAKYVDDLPIPPAYTPAGVMGGVTYYDIALTAFTQKLHRDLPPTYLWGYGGTYPSRSIEAVVGTPIRVRFRNNLLPTNPHPVASAIDYVNIGGMVNPATGQPWPDQRITTHLHGGHVPWQSDGGPRTWYTGPYFGNNGKKVISDILFNGDTNDYPNNQLGSTLWFHDHAMGITRLNVIAGLAGFYLLRNPQDAQFNLPSGPFEIPLAIQDRIFNADGSLFYPPPPAVPEFFGDTMLVNGKVWPRLAVQPRKYRFRLLNGCNARFLRMQLVQANADNTLPSVRNWNTLPFNQIGAEGGFFAAPTGPFTVLTMGPAERADVIVDFSAFAGKSLILYNDAATPFSGTADTRGAIPEVMLFQVSAAPVTDTSTIPTSFDGVGGFVDRAGNQVLTPADIAGAKRVIKTLDEITLPNGMLMQLINQVGFEMDPFLNEPVAPDVSRLGTTEIWEYVNTTVDTHPIHTHQTMFQVLSRQPFNSQQYQTKRVHGVPLDPTPFLRQTATPARFNEVGWKDTVQANPGEVTRIAMKWLDYTGHYVFHCHILEHEEHDMMRALEIV